MSKSQYITFSSAIPIYSVLLEHIERLLDNQSNYFCPMKNLKVIMQKQMIPVYIL